MLTINEQVSIPEDELNFTASASSGPGGQHVNKVSTRITLWFDVANSPSFSREQKDLVMRRLGSRIGKDGVLRVISQQTRSQAANRELAVKRFMELMQAALRRIPARKKSGSAGRSSLGGWKRRSTVVFSRVSARKEFPLRNSVISPWLRNQCPERPAQDCLFHACYMPPPFLIIAFALTRAMRSRPLKPAVVPGRPNDTTGFQRVCVVDKAIDFSVR